MSYNCVTEIRVFETPWTELPQELTACFSAQERLAYQEGAPFFKELSKSCGERILIKSLSSLDDDQPMWSYIERQGTDPPQIWFGFTYRHLYHQPQFQLAVTKPELTSIPRRLEKLFSAFSGVRDGEQDGGGLRSPRLMTGVELRPYAESLESLDSERYAKFFSFDNGDVVAWDDNGSAVLFDHETKDVYTRDLNDFLDDYFSDLSQSYRAALESHRERRKK